MDCFLVLFQVPSLLVLSSWLSLYELANWPILQAVMCVDDNGCLLGSFQVFGWFLLT